MGFRIAEYWLLQEKQPSKHMVKQLWITFIEESNRELNVYSMLNVVMGWGTLALVKILILLL